MNNFLCTAALDRMSERLAAPIPDPVAAERYRELARMSLMNDPRVAVPATPEEIAEAPPWARAAAAAGKTLHVFTPHPDAVGPLRRGAFAVRDAWLERRHLGFTDAPNAEPHAQPAHRDVEELFAKIKRMSLDVICEKARRIASARRRRRNRPEPDPPRFPEQIICAAPGRVWRRVLSVSELAALGAEMRNCLAARSSHHASYAGQLVAETATFWVLRDERGAARMAVMIRSIDKCVLEAKGPRNAIVLFTDPNLQILLKALDARMQEILLPPIPTPQQDELARRTAALRRLMNQHLVEGELFREVYPPAEGAPARRGIVQDARRTPLR